MLLGERERQRELDVPNRPLLAAPPMFPAGGQAIRAGNPIAPQYPAHRYMEPANEYEFDWMTDPGFSISSISVINSTNRRIDVLCTRHPFTTDMMRDLQCGYCDVLLNSVADLQYHLSHVRRHPVYACCGRFFRREIDYERHGESYSHRFGGRHVHQFSN